MKVKCESNISTTNYFETIFSMKILSTTRFKSVINKVSHIKTGLLLILLVLSSFSIFATVDPPGVVKNPNVATVCRGSALTVSLTGIPVSGCTCNYQQQYMLPGEATWTSMALGASIVPNTAGTAQIRARIQCTGGAGCDTSAWTTVAWTVVDLPTTPTTITRFPSSDICLGGNVSATASGSTGGTGSCYYLYTFFQAGRTQGGYSTTNTHTSDTVSTLYVKAKYYCDGYGCDTSNYTSASWTVAPDPLAPILVKNPNLDSVCLGAVVTASFSSNTGGTGTCFDYFRYSDNGGVSWSSWSTTMPNVTVTNIGQIVKIQGKKECDGTGCNSSDTSVVTWKGIADPVWGAISLSEDSLCLGGQVTMTASTIGGSGGSISWYRYYNPPYTGLTAAASPNTPPSVRTYYYFPQYSPIPSNSGCNLDTGSNKKLVVVADPSWSGISVTPTNDCIGASITLGATLNGGLSGATISWIRDTVSNGPGITVTSPNTPGVADTYYYRPHYNPAANPRGCGVGDGGQRTVNIYPLPVAQTINGTPVGGSTVCIGATISATFSGGTNSLGSEANEYQYSINGGGSWATYTPGSSINATTVGSSIIQIRTRKAASGTFCYSDWNTTTWNVSAGLVAPSLNIKTPNISSVCAGTLVNATINAGSGGVGCSDVIEYTINNGGSWNTYTSGQIINTTTATEVIIRAWRGNCDASSGCVNTSVVEIARWSVTAPVIAATLTPAGGQVCSGTSVSASINTPGSGGSGCSDLFQSRYRSSGIWSSWTSYTPGNNISSTGRDSIQIRSIRSCDALSGCADTVSYTWVVNNYTVTSPTLTKLPNVATICEGTMVSASLLTPGSGGNGCSDSYQYRTNNGSWSAWASYTLGTNITTSGLSGVEIRTWRANCLPGGICGDSTINTYSWAVVSQVQDPSITRYPLSSIICNSDTVRGTISWGGGGSGCTNYAQYRLKTGTTWSAWYAYTSGQNILANGRTEIEIKAWTGNCTGGTGCNASDTAIENWLVSPNLVNPTLNRIPNRTSICQEEFASATLNSAGSGGIGCSDVFEVRTNNGTWSAWSPYNLGDPVSGAGLNLIEIRGYRGCVPASSCNTPSPYVISWTVVATATPPTITRVPDQDEVCSGTSVSATIVAGTGGISCFDYRQYRYFNGTTWSSWTSYTSGNSISTSGRTIIQARAFRGCQPTTGCESTDTSMVEWDVVTGITHPTMSKSPNLDTVCQGTSIAATIATAGIGGVGCTDEYLFRIKVGGVWNSWGVYNPPGTGIPTDLFTEGVEISANRTNCTSGITCGSATGNTYSWVVVPLPIAPEITRVPNSDYICSGQTASVTTTPGSGYSCSDYFQYRRFNGTTWSSWAFYPAGYNIPSTGYQTIEVRGFNRNCNVSSGCTPDTNIVSWTVSPTIVAPTLTKNPNVTSVCDGCNVSGVVAGGSGGIDCTNMSEYSFDGVSWSAYNSGDAINTSGATSVTIRAYRDNCNPAVPCPSSDTVSVTWSVSDQPIPPSVIRIPDLDMVCSGASVSGNITVGSGGVGCTDAYKYRTHNGTTWSAWNTYPIGYNISTTGRTQIEIQVYRTCSGTGCLNTDTTTVHWDVDATIVNPTLTKNPNLASVCDGANVSATVATPGSGGNGCSDVLESSVDGGLSWVPYPASSLINTSGLTSVRIRAYRGNCITGGCIPTDTNSVVWTVTAAPIEPVITRIPDLDDVCYGSLVSATITVGTGGTGCQNYSQYRIFNGSTWTTWYNYTSGNNIVYPSNAVTIEMRAFRGNCTSGCASSDTATASWNIIQSMINPILAKTPNTATIVENTDVSATVSVPGSNGNGCQDVLQYRVNLGAGYGVWTAYNAGDPIPTGGLTAVQIRGYRGNCSGGDICPAADTTLYTWLVVQGPQAPDILRNPDLDDICTGTPISATVTINGGGVGCTDYAQYRTYNGTTWAAWTAYTSGNNIPYPAGTTQVQVRAFRGNCDPVSGDLSSDTTLVSWNIFPTLVNPILAKNPNVAAVCAGINVSATIQTAGSGGTSCSDLLEYRANNGSGFSSWQSYNAGDPIPTTGFTEVQVRGFRGGCLSGLACPPADTTIYSWTISAEPISPLITRNPDLDDVCNGTALSATITPGSGGSGCTEFYQSRQYNGTTWTAWTAYTSGANIAYGVNITRIELRAFRGNCNPASGCTSSDTTTAFWNILPKLVRPLIAKAPTLSAVCQGVDVSASITTPGSGGVGCSDIMDYRTNNGSGYGAWTPYTTGDLISTLGLTGVEIRANRENCTSGDECPATDTIVSWIVNDGPTAPQLTRVPDQNSVCRNTNISASVVSGSGGDGCTDVIEYRLFNGSTWSTWIAYTPSSNIGYMANTDQVEVRGYRAYCDIASGCTSSDTNLVSWFITDNLANPILARHPDIDSVCTGINVYASILTPGSGGIGCSDVLEYRVNSGAGYSAWFAYGENDLIPTAGYTQIQVRGYIGNCTGGDECPPADTTLNTWVVNPSLTAPIVTRIPNQDVVCRGTIVSATITPGSGGNGCSEYYQYRLFNGTTWTPWSSYISGNNISYNPSDVRVQVRVFRGNCNVASGCLASDTNLVTWDIQEYLINPILEKFPDVTAICNVSDVYATVTIPSSGGAGCNDILQYRTNSGAGFGAWQPYAASDLIPTAGYTEIQVRGFIGNCISGDECPPADTTIYSWTIQAAPIAPTITRVPNTDDVCSTTAISATITPGSGGTGCTETAQYRLFNGATWGAWTAYTSGNNIPYIASTQTVEVRAFRGNCNPMSGCLSSDTNTVSWNIIKTLVNPILTQVPAIATVCQGTDVSATIQTPGSGGVGCSDILEYRINSGAGFGAWFSYNAGDPLPTFGLIGVEIRGFTGNCSNGSQCPPTDTTIYSWSVTTSPIAPLITPTPNLDTVCRGTALSATIIAGTGGSGCADTYQKRTFNGTTWSAWSAYVSGANIVYAANITQVEVRVFRGGCTALAGCVNSDTNIVHWVISEQPVNAVLAKTPNTTTVCDGTLVSTAVTTPGSGGSGCTDAFDYRTFDGSTWSAWSEYIPTMQIVTTGLTQVQIIAYRENCDAGSSCTPPAADTVSWTVVPQPSDPNILRNPDVNTICFGGALSATVTPGTGGASCTNYSQYRAYNGTTWTAWANYTSGNNIVYGATITRVEVRAFRSNCDPLSNCLASDTSVVSWDIVAQPVGPVMEKVPNLAGICEGVDVSATLTTPGSGGVGCSDIFEYRTNNGFGFSAWQSYTPGNLLGSSGLTQIEIRSYRGGCSNGTCNQSTPVVFNWTITTVPTAPVLTAVPSSATVCQGTQVSATAVAGTGGLGCSDIYQYRTFNGTTWTAWLSYTPANMISTVGIQHVDIRGYRSCDPASGCLSMDTSMVSWDVYANIVSPIMTKVPNVNTVCEGINVSATLVSSGSGGTGCIDIFEYSTNGGTSWLAYTPGNQISTIGLTNVQIRFYRGGCPDALLCGSAPTTFTWNVVPPIIAPTLTKTPDLLSLCEGTALKAIVTAGSGGSSCSDVVEYRTYNGTVWTAWTPYVSNTNINSVGISTLEIRAYRGNCAVNSSCIASDTNTAIWNVFPQPVAPVLSKLPNTATVCEGTSVSASLTSAGFGGSNCSDVIQYRTNNGSGYGAWAPYTPPTAIPTTGLTAVQIISYRGNCDPGSLCIQTAVDTITWTTAPALTDPTITRVPDSDTLCTSAVISAIVTPATGGTGCTNYSQYRMLVGTIWTGWINYTSGNTINHGANVSEVQVRAFRGNCNPSSGCGTSDTAFVNWIFTQEPTGPVLQKNPDLTTVCEGSTVNATVITPGIGGDDCSDVINYRINNGSGYGAWMPYTPGTPIATTGLTRIQMVSYRGNCNPLAGCTQSTADSILWLVIPEPTNPIVIRTPDEDTLCRGTLLSATITSGTGGDGCSNYSESRTFDGTTWSAWTNYTSGAVVPYANNVIRVEVRAYRGNCTVGAGCDGSDTVSVFWNINPQPVAPIFAKNPDVAGVCTGTSVSATVTTPGSGGVGCTDNSEYRIHNGTSWSAWLSYTAGTSIVTTGLTQVEIRSWRGACPIAGCISTDTTTLSWVVNATTTEPTITRVPDQDLVCQGTLVSATINSGTGGSGCSDASEFRTLASAVWTAWAPYTSTNIINTVGIDSVQVRSYRLCPPTTGCPSTDTILVAWKIANTIIMPVLAKVPNTDSICETTMIGATMVTPGSGGTGCADIYEISTNGGGTWSAYTPGSMINSAGFTDVRIRFTRGGCPEATLCGSTPVEFKWIIVPQATEPLIVKNPAIDGVCEGTPLSGTITPGSGGVGCTDTYQSRTNNGTVWSAWTAYTSGSNINTAGMDTVQIRVFRGNCNALSGCFSTDTTTITWNVYPQPIAPVLLEDPSTTVVCQGTDVSATLVTPGSGGAGCSDVIEYRVDNGAGYGAWAPYTPPTLIPTIGVTAVQIISYRGNCDVSSMCVQTAVDTITWTTTPPVTDPIIVRNPDIDTLCSSTVVSATITPATGGVGCTNYSKFRMKVGTIWTGWINYTSGNTIPHGVNVSEIQVRAYRGNCDDESGCGTSDTVTIGWVFTPDPIGPVLQRNPDISPVCDGSNVSATLITPGTGGSGCSDIFNFRTDNGSGYGAWATYVPGTDISTAGLTRVQIVSQRGNCNPTANCTESQADTIFWIVMPNATAPTIARTPNIDTICNGSAISANITNGTGGSGCSNINEYRMFDGSTWSAWTNYINNTAIPYPALTTQIEVRAFRGNCDALAGCVSSDTTIVNWAIAPQPINPVLNKLPDVVTVCEGTNVWATLATAGSGGVGCSDIFEYRTRTGVVYSAWNPYTIGTNINTTGYTAVQIISMRGNCDPLGLCTPPPADTITWLVVPQPQDPIIVRVPNNDTVCNAVPLSATITNGTGGIGCINFSQFRIYNGTSWSAWAAYTSGNNIPYGTTDTEVEVRAWRGDCATATGCLASDTITANWVIAPALIRPIISKVPDTDSICSGDVRAEITTAGSGGLGCSDVYEYRIDNGAGYGAWSAYIPGTNIPTVGVTAVQIHAYRGNCSGTGCVATTDTTVTWIMTTPPIGPTIVRTPDQGIVCQGTFVSGTITAGTGGSPCGDIYEYRTQTATVWGAWQTYTSTTPIATLGLDSVEIRAYRLCNPIGGCASTDTALVNWSVSSAVIMPVMTKVPAIAGVCDGTDVSATLASPGSGGSAGCSDIYEFRTYSAGLWTALAPYTPGNLIPTTGLDSIEIQYSRGGCPEALICNASGPSTFIWYVAPHPTAPTIVRVPDLDSVCSDALVSGTITVGTDGAGCTDIYEYRSNNGTTWTAWLPYVSAQNIAALGKTEIEIRVYRNNCLSGGGCIGSDTNSIHWAVMPPIVPPVLIRVPDVDNMCQNNFVQANLVTPGSGGLGCSDVFEYRTNNGSWSAWQTYVPGTTINSTGIDTIQIISYRGNCSAGSLCVTPPADTLSWNFVAPPTPPTIVRVPDNNICNSEAISATITPGTGGLGCSDTYQFRTYDGTTWSIWLSYTSGNNIPYPANATQVEVRAFRANCNPASGCDIADTTLVNWQISVPIVNPVVAKNPNIAGVCDGTPVSATVTTPGTGGLNCTDTYEYRTNSGAGFGAWMPYIPATDIPTTGLTEVEIRFVRDNCDPLNVCPPPAPEVLNWFVAPQPIAPTVTRTPNVDSLCAGPELSGTITPGSGGAGCVDIYEYRLQDTLGVWTAWMPYMSDSLIQSDTIRGAQIRVSRTNCFVGSGCAEPAPMVVEWMVFPQPITPVLTRIPDQDAVCETTLLTAVQTGDAGGVPPTTIQYFYENPGEWTWTPGNSFVPNANGMAYIKAKATSNGYGCIDSEWEWVSWIVDPKPIVTTPADQTICEGGSVQLDAVAEGGYGTYTFAWEMSTTSCAGPWTPIADSTRASLVTGSLSDTTWYRVTTTQQATSCFDVSNCIAVFVKPAPAVTISGNTTVCSGGTTLTATVTNEPNPVTYQWQYSTLASGPWVLTGSNSNTLTIPNVTGALYYQCTVIGDTIGCTATSAATLVQLGTVPVITYNSTDTNVCNGQNLYLNVVAQAIPAPTYQWYGPSGLIVGAISDTLYLNNSQATDAGTYYCEVMSFCDTVATPNIQVGVLQNIIAATTITGTSHRCQGAGFDMYTTDAQNVLTNSWSMTPPEAGTINPTTGFASWNGTFAGTALISVNNIGCDTTTSIFMSVIVDTTVIAPTISGTITRCEGVSSDQYVAVSPGATSFVWSISNAGTSTIDINTGIVNWDSTFIGTATIYAYANGCGGPSELGELAVITIDSVRFTQSGTQHWCENDSNALWVSPTPNAGNSFQWFDQVGEITGATDTMLVFNPVQASNQGSYYCRIITLCGDTLFSSPDSIYVHPLPVVNFSINGACRLDTISFTNLSTVTDGTLSYQWMFGDGESSTNMDPTHIYLVADTFSVVLTATSSWGCSQSFSLPLIIHDLPTALVTTIGDSCFNGGTGSIILSPTFGTPPFTYGLGSGPSQVDSIFAPLPAGNYFVTITDSNGCKSILPATVDQPNALRTHIYPTNVLCYDDSSGVADLEVLGGTQPYQYLWTNGQMSEDLINVPVGNYGVAIMDANGCIAVDSVTLLQPNPIIVDSMVVQTTCLQLNDGKIFVFVSGGTGVYDYLWSTGSLLDSIVNLTPNTYQITVTDGNGCKSIHQYLINENNNECITIWNSFSPDGDGTNDVWNIGHIDLYPECTVQIFNRWGAQLFESKGYNQPWDGTWNNKNLPAETYYFVINLGDGTDPITGTVTIIR